MSITGNLVYRYVSRDFFYTSVNFEKAFSRNECHARSRYTVPVSQRYTRCNLLSLTLTFVSRSSKVLEPLFIIEQILVRTHGMHLRDISSAQAHEGEINIFARAKRTELTFSTQKTVDVNRILSPSTLFLPFSGHMEISGQSTTLGLLFPTL